MGHSHETTADIVFNWLSKTFKAPADAPHGQKTSQKMTDNMQKSIHLGIFHTEEFCHSSQTAMPDDWETASITYQDKKTGNTLLHDAILSGPAEALRVVIQIGRARDELNAAFQIENYAGRTAPQLIKELTMIMDIRLSDAKFDDFTQAIEDATTLEEEASIPKMYYEKKALREMSQAMNNAVEHNKMRQNFRKPSGQTF